MKIIIPTLFLALTALLPVQADDSISLSVRNEGQDAVRRGFNWLLSKQQEGGHWSSPDWPALTGLSLWALSLDPAARESEAAQKAVNFIKSKAHPNGAIYVEPAEMVKAGGKPNYNTAICMVGLHLSGREDVRPLVLNARRYVAAGQHLGGDVYHGGFGYDAGTKRAYADLSNTYIAMEGLALTESAEDLRTDGKPVRMDKESAAEFVSRIQNLKETNEADWVSESDGNKGGFAYHPEESKAGEIKTDDGNVYFRSFGSMTYAGLLSLIYADVDRNDVRVRSALDWSLRHWSLDENPGMGKQGHYYFLNVLSKALAVYGQDILKQDDGSKINWREAFIKKLVGIQKIDENGNGYWQNEENRFWENDPHLVTAYSLIALQIALGNPESE